jgi:4'-phosphopantetheinyl transferase
MGSSAPRVNMARLRGRNVRQIRVSAELDRIEWHWQHLDAAEQQRAARFRLEADRARFVIARSSLRQMLAQRVGVTSHEIEFSENGYGKPLLRHACVGLHFNTSHSGDWVMHAIDNVAPVGIDVEVVRTELADIDQFERVLAPEESSLLIGVPARGRARAFAKVWVRKEAYVKALGEGVSRPLQDISIAVDAKGRPHLLYDRSACGSLARWQFEDIEVDAEHVACLVFRGDD